VNVEPPVQMDGEVVSSTRVRQCLRDGAVDQAARYLGRPFTLRGVVVTGQHRGRTLGIPTANLAVPEEVATPAVGVYACQAQTAAGQRARAVVNIGFRPTFNGGEPRPTIEAHLLDFNQDLYGQPLRLDFIARLRGEQKFAGIEALVAQIRRDIEAARQLVI
jgi:riboflavin kinase/FMN adenylyltransferase